MNAATRIEDTGTVAPLLPLGLLESIRAHDRPSEVLEDEDLAASLPRRLGLTGVIDSQIRQYDEARRKKRRVASEPVADLLRLILRRPDAAAIFREAGQNIARRRYAQLPSTYRGLLRVLPRRLRRRAWRRGATAMVRRIVGEGRVAATSGGPGVRVTGGLLAATDPTGAACLVYQGALEELGRLYVGAPLEIRETSCIRSGAAMCEWRVVD